MRKICLCLLMIALVLLPACDGGTGGPADAPAEQTASEAARQVRTEYLAAGSCGGTVDVTADYGMRVYDFTLDFSWQREGDALFTVTAPEELAGLSARITDGQAYLEFDGVSLGTGDLTGEGLTPMELLPALMEYTDEGYMAECVFEALGEEQALRVVFRDPESPAGAGGECVQWFRQTDHALLRAELYWDGQLVVSGAFQNFTLGDGASDGAGNETGQNPHLGGDQPGEPGA